MSELVSRADILQYIDNERSRQEMLRREGKFVLTCATFPGLSEYEKLAVLAEEFGEVAKEVTELCIRRRKLEAEFPNKYTLSHLRGIFQGTAAEVREFASTREMSIRLNHHECIALREKIRIELIQVAAVCVAWIESIEEEKASLP